MTITVQFFSYFKDLAGCAQHEASVSHGATMGELLNLLYETFPRLEPLRKSTLVAVGVEYQDRTYVLREGDVVSLFPPVQGG